MVCINESSKFYNLHINNSVLIYYFYFTRIVFTPHNIRLITARGSKPVVGSLIITVYNFIDFHKI